MWNTYRITYNYVTARKIGLPVIVCPVDTLNPLWQFYRPFIAPTNRRWPYKLGQCVRYSYIGWPWKLKYQLHARNGPPLTVVSPEQCQVVVGDVRAVNSVLNRWKDFTKILAILKGLNSFGPNLLSAEGETWRRHRRITISPFNERNSSLVWIEAINQAKEVLGLWISPDANAATGFIKTDNRYFRAECFERSRFW